MEASLSTAFERNASNMFTGFIDIIYTLSLTVCLDNSNFSFLFFAELVDVCVSYFLLQS